MKSLKLALAATLVAASAMAGAPAWADRGNAGFNRDRGGGHFERDHGDRQGHNAWGWGLGLLAGSAILIAATQPRPMVVQTAMPAFAPPAPPLAVYSPPSAEWWYYCATSAAYYPYVTYCPSGWAKVPAAPRY